MHALTDPDTKLKRKIGMSMKKTWHLIKTKCMALPLLALSMLLGLAFWPPGMPPLQSAEQDPTLEKAVQKNVAIFAGGCFWCVESDFDKVEGVLETISGYTGGHTSNPTYKEVSYNDTGHYEAVKIIFNPEKVSYKTLVHIFWRTVDPTDGGGQFCDRGKSYRTAIFPVNKAQQQIAETSKTEEQTSGRLKGRIVTPIIMAKPFYPAEGYHQNYYQKNKLRYTYYRFGCGRDKRIKALWGPEAHKGLKGK